MTDEPGHTSPPTSQQQQPQKKKTQQSRLQRPIFLAVLLALAVTHVDTIRALFAASGRPSPAPRDPRAVATSTTATASGSRLPPPASSLSANALRTLRRHAFVLRTDGASRRTVILTAAAHPAHLSNARNLHCTARDGSAHSPVVLAFDAATVATASAHNLPCLDLRARSAAVGDGDGDGTALRAHNRTALKFAALADALAAGFDVLFTDMASVWCGNVPVRVAGWYAVLRPRPHVLLQNARKRDHMWPPEPSTAFLYARAELSAAPSAHALFAHLAALAMRRPALAASEQTLFRKAVCTQKLGLGLALRANRSEGTDTHTCRWRDAVRVEMLPVSEFPNAHWPFGRRSERNESAAMSLQRACGNGEIALFNAAPSKSDPDAHAFDLRTVWVDENGAECRLPATAR